MSHHFEMSNKYVFCRLSIIHVFFHCHIRSKTICKRIWNNKGWIKETMKANGINKLNFKITLLNKWHINNSKIVHHNVETMEGATLGWIIILGKEKSHKWD